MNSRVNLPPNWHSDELNFMTMHHVIREPGDLREVQRVKQRWIHNTLREVFLTPNGFVIKRFTHFPGRKDFRKVWEREHKALRHLNGLNVPESIGFTRVNHGPGVSGVLYLRSLLPGSPVTWESDTDISHLAELLASFHSRGVITLDPQQENFVFTDDQRRTIGFIDFGRARIFRHRTPLMLFHVGKETAKLQLEGGLDSHQSETYRRQYSQYMPMTGLQKGLINLSIRYWLQRNARKQKRKKSL